MRTKNSCRFTTYYKLEWFDPKLSVWRPLQKAFNTEYDARGAFTSGRKWRVLEVSQGGWRVMP